MLGWGEKEKSEKARPFFFFFYNAPSLFWGWIVVEPGEIPVIVRFSVNGTEPEHPARARLLRAAPGSCRRLAGCRAGAALQRARAIRAAACPRAGGGKDSAATPRW